VWGPVNVCTAAYRLIVIPHVFNVPTFTARRLHVTTTLEILVAKGGTLLGENLSGNFAESSEFHATLGIFYMPQIYDMGQTALLPLRRGSHAEDFFALKNPTASAGFEPANLGTKGQHATPRPPKPLSVC
jgi:hypothetical protein